MIKLNDQKFLAAINDKWASKNCPMCGHNNWNVSSNIVTALRIAEKGGISLGGDVMPLVAITCMNCGNVIFVNPLIINSLDKDNNGAPHND